MRIEPLEGRLLLHAGHDHAPAPPPAAASDLVVSGAPAPSANVITPAAPGDPLLPDMFPLVSQEDEYVYGWTLDTGEIPGRILLRLTTAMANRGRGAMELTGGTSYPDGTQDVFQRIFLEGGGSTTRLAGKFIYHPEHEHIHFDNFATYNLRDVTAGSGVGNVRASGDKISFCLLDIDHFATLPGSPASSHYDSCGQTQGVSVGWADIYDQSLPDQWIDVTDVPDGTYWLEVVSDPENRLTESDETNNAARIQINLDKPSPDPMVVAHNPVGQYPAPASAVDFIFDQPMRAASFSVADDVVSFTGPTGADLRGAITGFSWPDTRTLRVSFTQQPATGPYSMTIGPNILASDNGAPMDQDRDETAGEATQDRYTATFTVTDKIGPDTFGYEARTVPIEDINLVRGAAGVSVLVDGVDDAASPVPLGAHTFNFYGVSYTGNSALFVSSNGLITFNSSTATYSNGDLVGDPTQATIAPLWDDLRTDLTTSDCVLIKFEDTTGDSVPDRLIIEWNDVQRHSDTAPAPGRYQTFQAILQLNTGAAAGAIVFNYRDLDTGSVAYANGADASVGIKAPGNQSNTGRRLLISRDRGNHPYVATGRAIRITRAAAEVVGEHLFYNNSAFDGGNPAANAADDAAVATDKSPFILVGGPGQPLPTFDNLSAYSRGINGVMLDLAGLFGRTPVGSDFDVELRRDGAGPWSAGPAPAVAVRRGAGVGGSDRVTLTWPDSAIHNTWLRLLVKPTASSGLPAASAFYFGHLAGETGDPANDVGASVGVMDLVRTRGATSPAAAPIASRFDHNRDGRVDVLDVALTRANQHATLPWIQIPPAAADPVPAVVTSNPRLTPTRSTGLLADETPIL